MKRTITAQIPETILINVTLSISYSPRNEICTAASCLVDDVADIFHDNKDCRHYRCDRDIGKNEKHQRRHEFDGRLRCYFFRLLPPLSPQGGRKSPLLSSQRRAQAMR